MATAEKYLQAEQSSLAEQFSLAESSPAEPPPQFEDILDTMARPKFQTIDEEQVPHRAIEEISAMRLRNQIQNAETRELAAVTDDDDGRDGDPLGTLLQVRRMSIGPQETEKTMAEEQNENVDV